MSLTATLQSVGDYTEPEVEFLQVALFEKATQAATARPLQVRIAQNAEVHRTRATSCGQFGEGPCRRERESPSWRRRWSGKSCGKKSRRCQTRSTHTATCTDVAALKAKLAMVEAKRDALRSTPPRPKKVQRTDRQGSPVIASTPNLVPAELEDWLKGLQADLQEALEFGEGETSLGTHFQDVGWARQNDGDGWKDDALSQDPDRDARYGLRG